MPVGSLPGRRMAQFYDIDWSKVPEGMGAPARCLCLYDELKGKFDAILSMNAARTLPKRQSMATFGLSGCIAGYIDGGRAHTLFHFSLEVGSPAGAVGRTLRGAPGRARRVLFFVPGTWAPGAGGGWGLKPEARYLADFLRPSLDYLRKQGVSHAVHSYDLDRGHGAHYQGTVWVDRQGGVFCEGVPVDRTPAPHDSENIFPG